MTRHLVDHLAKSLASPMTRRASIGVFAAAMLTLSAGGEEADAKRKKKRRKKRKRKGGTGPGNARCLRLAEICVPNQTQSCCDGLQCELSGVEGATGSACCQSEGTACSSASYKSCCSGTCDSLVGGGSCAPCRGRSCAADRPCCGGETCQGGYCGGCRDRATACTTKNDCCFSDCTSGACLSLQGGTCARDVDCRACYLGGNCDGACVNGACTV
jgi:hypothetical protein